MHPIFTIVILAMFMVGVVAVFVTLFYPFPISEAYLLALTLYKLFGLSADAGIPGADAIAAQLKQRFASTGNSGTPPATPSIPE